MRRKLTYLVCFVFVLGLVSSASADLVARWQFNDNADDSVGTLNWDPNGVTYSTDAREGAKSVSLNGVDAYLSQTAAGGRIHHQDGLTLVQGRHYHRGPGAL